MTKENKQEKFKAHEGDAPLLNEGDERNPWLDIPHDANWLDAVSPDGVPQQVCGDCGLRRNKE